MKILLRIIVVNAAVRIGVQLAVIVAIGVLAVVGILLTQIGIVIGKYKSALKILVHFLLFNFFNKLFK